jgi:hypothetical protein
LATNPTGARPRVDAAHAHLVAAAHLAARREPTGDLVRAAYRDLALQASALFAALTEHGRTRVRVVFTRSTKPYATADELSESVRIHRLLEVIPAHRDRYRRHPLLDSSVGGAYDRLRAVHDIVSHGHGRLGFDPDGEWAAWLIEDRLYAGLARWALATELHGEHSVLWTTGHQADHKATLLDRSIIAVSRRPTVA